MDPFVEQLNNPKQPFGITLAIGVVLLGLLFFCGMFSAMVWFTTK